MPKIDWSAKPTTAGYLLATLGTAIGIYAGVELGHKIEQFKRQRKTRKSLEYAMKNPIIVPNVPDSPIDKFLNGE